MRIAILAIESSHVDQFVTLISSSRLHELAGVGIVDDQVAISTVVGDQQHSRFPQLAERLTQLGSGLDSVHAHPDSWMQTPLVIGTAQFIAEQLCTHNSDGIDAVVIADRSSAQHYSHALHFLERGLAVFVDKPFTPTIRQAEELLDAALERRAPITSFSALRYAPFVTELASELRAKPGHLTVSGSFSQHSPYGADFYLVHCAEIALTLIGPSHKVTTCTYNQGVLTARVASMDGASTVEIRALEEEMYGYLPHQITMLGQAPVTIPLPPLYLQPGFELWLASLTNTSDNVFTAQLPQREHILATVSLTQRLVEALPAESL